MPFNKKGNINMSQDNGFEMFLEHPIFKGYWISHLGGVLSTRRKSAKRLKSWLVRGYPTVRLWRGSEFEFTPKRVHSLVAETFLLEPQNKSLEINHKDGNKANPWLGNLEWCTHTANLRHAVKMRLRRGKLTPIDIPNIRLLLSQGKNARQIAQIYKVSRFTIGQIALKKTWSYV